MQVPVAKSQDVPASSGSVTEKHLGRSWNPFESHYYDSQVDESHFSMSASLLEAFWALLEAFWVSWRGFGSILGGIVLGFLVRGSYYYLDARFLGLVVV